MRDQLVHYIDLLFAGAANAGDIKQEILQNTLDRYDDLISQGKTPESAYSLAISGIGDISELLAAPAAVPAPESHPAKSAYPDRPGTPVWKKIFRAAAVFLYIISVIPLFILSELGMEVIGLCGTVAIVGIATVLIILAAGNGKDPEKKEEIPQTPQQEMRTAVKRMLTAVAVIIYLILSFATQAWHNTWLIFPIMAAVRGLVFACMDLKEEKKHES